MNKKALLLTVEWTLVSVKFILFHISFACITSATGKIDNTDMQEYSKSLDNCDCTPSEHKFVERITDYKILLLIFYVLFIIIYIYYEWLSFAYLLFNSIEELEWKSKQNIRRIFAPMAAIIPFIGVYVLTPIIYIHHFGVLGGCPTLLDGGPSFHLLNIILYPDTLFIAFVVIAYLIFITIQIIYISLDAHSHFWWALSYMANLFSLFLLPLFFLYFIGRSLQFGIWFLQFDTLYDIVTPIYSLCNLIYVVIIAITISPNKLKVD